MLNKVTSIKLVTFISLLICSSLSFASDEFYISARGGYSFLNKLDSSQTKSVKNLTTADQITRSFVIEPKGGFNFGAAFGMYFCTNFRVELDVSHLISETKKVSATIKNIKSKKVVSTLTASDKKSQSYSITNAGINAYYELSPINGFAPFAGLGVGAGMLQTKYEINSRDIKAKESLMKVAVSFQGIAGCAYNIDKNFSVTAEYRLLFIAPIDYAIPGKSAKKQGFSNSSSYIMANSANLGIKYIIA